MDLSTDRLLESRPLVWLGAAAILLAILSRLLRDPRDPREPPYIESRFPLIGHVFSLWRDGARYFTELDRQHHHGIYTLPILPLPILKSNMYVAGSPEWANAVQKHSGTIDLYTLSTRALETLTRMDADSMAIITRDLHGEKKKTQDNIMFVLRDVMLKSLSPGPDLDQLNHNLLRCVQPLLNGLAPSKDGPQKMMFWAWIKQHISEVFVAAAYGDDNPVARDTGLVDDFWTFDANAASLMMPFPAIFARKGHLAQSRFVNGFADYARRGGYKQAASLIQNRAKEAFSYGIEISQYGHLESNFAPGLLSNTVPATFWLISRIFEDRQLLSDIRAEIDACTDLVDGKKVIRVSRLQAECPLYSSAFMETLRTVSPLNTYRYVREDTLITNSATKQSYLLKKDRLIQLAATVLHAREEVWGPGPEVFDARRFLPVVNKARAAAATESGGVGKAVDPAAPFRDQSGKMHAGSFRPFGGGVHLCPGRFFAQTGIQAAAAVFIAGFDMESVGDGGKYVAPGFKDARGFMFLSTIKPERDVEVVVKRREGYEDVEWEFDLSK